MKAKTTIYKKQLLELALIRAKIKRADKNGFVHCCTCGLYTHWTNLCGGHFIPRAKGDSCRFELDNINQQCSGCNGLANQGEQYKHGLYIDENYYKGRAEELHKQSRTLRKRRIQELEEAINLVEICISDWYDHQDTKQRQILIDYITKNGLRKSKCKGLLARLS